MSKFEIDLKKVIESKLSLDEYFLLYCLYNNADELLEQYKKNVDFIGGQHFPLLESLGYIRTGNMYHNGIEITDAGRQIITQRVKIKDSKFEEFRKSYPTMVKFGHKTRRLQGNLEVCEKLYSKILVDDKITHETLCKCAKAYWNEQAKNDGGWFTKLMEGWLRQKLYKNYIDDIENINLNEKIDDINNLDVI
jgi:hypothetical protein